MKLRTLIIDDEYLARDLLKAFLKDYHQVDIVGECENGFDGIAQINELKPDLVLLDIQMPKLTGLEMLEMLEHQSHIVFITAYDQYALKAFELNAVDYLLKPFNKQRLFEALDRVVVRVNAQEKAPDKGGLAHHAQEDSLSRIVVKYKQRIVVVPVEDIFHVEAMDDYVLLHTKSMRYVKQCTMKSLEESLDASLFVRVHRSHMVQISQIERIENDENNAQVVLLKCGKQVKVSKSGFKRLKEVL
ncbi:MAG: LytR/AlgR family response regulator transcription factor [Mangrovibacterium sp.]